MSTIVHRAIGFWSDQPLLLFCTGASAEGEELTTDWGRVTCPACHKELSRIVARHNEIKHEKYTLPMERE